MTSSIFDNTLKAVQSRALSALFAVACAAFAIQPIAAQEAPDAAAAAAEEDGGSLAAAQQEPVDEKAAEEAVKQQIAQRRQYYFDALLKELDNMVPGEYEEESPQKAELAKAVNAFLDRDPQKVVLIFEEQAAFDPDFPPKNLMLAAMSYMVRNAKGGRVLLERAAKENPKYPGTYAAFARLALNEGRITDAMALLEKCAKMVREGNVNDKVKNHFGRQYIEGMLEVAIAQERFDDARGLLNRQMEQKPDNPKSFLTGAELEFKAGKLDQSQSYLEKLKELVPATRPHEAIFGNWFQQSRKPNEASKWIQAAAKKYPEDASVQLDYAKWALAREDIQVASAAVAQVEKLVGEKPASQFMRGQLEFVAGNYDKSEALFEAVAKGQGKSASLDVINLYALSLIESSDEKKQATAQNIAQRNLSRARGNKVAQANLAYILLKRGNTEQAQRLLLPVAQNSRVSPEVAYYFGVLTNALGKKDQARQALQLSLKHKGLFIYRKKAKELLDQLGGPIADLPAPAAAEK